MEVLEGLSKGQNLIIETQNSEARALVAQSQAISIPWQQQTVTSHAESCDHVNFNSSHMGKWIKTSIE